MSNDFDCECAAPALPLVEVTALTKVYAQRRWLWSKQRGVTAVENACLSIFAGEVQGIVGVSGSGKSTLALCIAGLESPTSGSVQFCGIDIGSKKGDELRRFRQSVQLVLQDSSTALNPRLTAMDIVTEPLLICGLGTREERHERALELMRQLELPVSIASRRPYQMSGGQRQRLAIARALTLKPQLLILDEVLTGLDVPVQRELLALLSRLRSMYSFMTLFISHDLRLMQAVADRIAVMHEGKIVEQGTKREVFANPQHAHTRALLNAMSRRDVMRYVPAGGN